MGSSLVSKHQRKLPHCTSWYNKHRKWELKIVLLNLQGYINCMITESIALRHASIHGLSSYWTWKFCFLPWKAIDNSWICRFQDKTNIISKIDFDETGFTWLLYKGEPNSVAILPLWWGLEHSVFFFECPCAPHQLTNFTYNSEGNKSLNSPRKKKFDIHMSHDAWATLCANQIPTPTSRPGRPWNSWRCSMEGEMREGGLNW